MHGIEWTLFDEAISHAENSQLDNINRYINLLTLMHHNSLSGQNISDILLALGSTNIGYFQKVFNNLLKIRLEEEYYGEDNQPIQIYYLQFNSTLDDRSELIESFVHHVGRVINLWLPDVLVETRLEKVDD
jgi:hypothetical protein